jgi:hypothetical protein
MCIHRNKTIDTNGIDCALVTSKSFQEEVEANQNEYKDNSGWNTVEIYVLKW